MTQFQENAWRKGGQKGGTDPISYDPLGYCQRSKKGVKTMEWLGNNWEEHGVEFSENGMT